jgi:hypothetical protein
MVAVVVTFSYLTSLASVAALVAFGFYLSLRRGLQRTALAAVVVGFIGQVMALGRGALEASLSHPGFRYPWLPLILTSLPLILLWALAGGAIGWFLARPRKRGAQTSDAAP